MLKNLKKYLKKYSKRFRKYNTTYDLDYLFNELNEPTKIQQKSIKEVRELFNDIRSNLSREETKKIRKKLHKKEKKEDGLTSEEKKVLKNLKKDLEKLQKLQKYQHSITSGLDYLFNEEDYELKEIKSSFDGNYMLYENK